jgi:hypothetical protein
VALEVELNDEVEHCRLAVMGMGISRMRDRIIAALLKTGTVSNLP